jgi:exoribonuclease II
MLKEGQLVLYKNKPALVVASGEKAVIRLPDASDLKVREKDVLVLHEGPLKGFNAQTALSEAGKGDFATARQMLEGPAGPAEVADLVFGNSGPFAVWAVVDDALSGSGSFALEGEKLRPLSDQEIDERERRRNEREGAEKVKNDFILRALEGAKQGNFVPEEGDARFLQEIEARASGSATSSKILKALKLEDTPESAHAFLLKTGVKSKEWDPYPLRSGVALKAPSIVIQAPETSGRVDLTGMESYAIDNAWSKDPDDAISFHDGDLWVHVADPACSVTAGGPADLEARARAATLYLPEGIVPMLPNEALDYFGLGLQPTSPALSFRIKLDGDCAVVDVQAMRSMVRVSRFSYQSADAVLDRPELIALKALAELNRAKRAKNGAVEIDLPEIHLWVEAGEPKVETPSANLSSGIVRECMLIAGEAAGRFAFREGIPFPYYGQEAPNEAKPMPGLAGEWAKRRGMRPGMISGSPVAHRGLGLSLYTQVTSPLRRYQDLLAHQQLSAHLSGAALMDQDDIVERTAQAQAAAAASRQAERSAYQHWKLVWLMNRPGWTGKAIVAADLGKRDVILIPELAFETAIPAEQGLSPNDEIAVKCTGVDLARLEARFSRA